MKNRVFIIIFLLSIFWAGLQQSSFAADLDQEAQVQVEVCTAGLRTLAGISRFRGIDRLLAERGRPEFRYLPPKEVERLYWIYKNSPESEQGKSALYTLALSFRDAMFKGMKRAGFRFGFRDFEDFTQDIFLRGLVGGIEVFEFNRQKRRLLDLKQQLLIHLISYCRYKTLSRFRDDRAHRKFIHLYGDLVGEAGNEADFLERYLGMEVEGEDSSSVHGVNPNEIQDIVRDYLAGIDAIFGHENSEFIIRRAVIQDLWTGGVKQKNVAEALGVTHTALQVREKQVRAEILAYMKSRKTGDGRVVVISTTKVKRGKVGGVP
jgi:hypothetical protein